MTPFILSQQLSKEHLILTLFVLDAEFLFLGELFFKSKIFDYYIEGFQLNVFSPLEVTSGITGTFK